MISLDLNLVIDYELCRFGCHGLQAPVWFMKQDPLCFFGCHGLQAPVWFMKQDPLWATLTRQDHVVRQ